MLTTDAGFAEVRNLFVQNDEPLPITLAERLCRDHGLPFSQVFAQQFHLCRGPAPDLAGFTRVRLGGWVLQHGRDLPVAIHRFADGTGHLAFLGLAVDPEGEVVTQELLERRGAGWHDAQALTTWLNSCAGRFAFVILQGATKRLYLDAAGSLGAVYDPETGHLASTLNLVLNREVEPNRDYPLAALASRDAARFAFGHTPDQWVKRVLPNHFLNLGDFSQQRFWPLPGDIVEPDEMSQISLTRFIATRLEQVISSLAKHVAVARLPISGGLDSRLLLASAKASLESIELFSHAENQMSRKDTRIAARLAARVDSDLQVVDPRRNAADRITDDAQLRQLGKAYQIATGLGQIDGEIPRTRLEVLMAHEVGGIVLRGNGTDFLKAVLWRRGVQEYVNGDAHDITTGIRMMMLGDKTIAENADIQAAYTRWYSDFSVTAANRAFDFMFSEQFLAHGQGNQLYGMTRNFYICPSIDRNILAAMTRLPPDRRAQLDYHEAILSWRAPELQDITYTRKAVNRHLEAKREAVSPLPLSSPRLAATG